MQKFHTKSADETIRLGGTIGDVLESGNIVALQGPLGCGKTTIVKGIAKSLEITEEITSPSYTLISEYDGSIPLYHMDLYRIDSIEDFELLGAEEFFYSTGVSLIEWAEKIENLLPDNTIFISFEITSGDAREVIIEGIQKELSF